MTARAGRWWRSPAALAEPWIVLAAALTEGASGYPERLHRRAPHPVAWLGAAICGLERAWNRPDRPSAVLRRAGIAALLLTVGAAGLAGVFIEQAAAAMRFGWIAMVLAGSLGLAGRSLYDHVAAVLRPLALKDLGQARLAVGRIVGRDVQGLDEAGIAAAALESLAESLCDGLVAPLFWFLAGGLPGLFAYKAVNTADSLIGHREPRWRDFGWAAARTDDLMNLVPARLSGALIALVGAGGWRVMLRDAGRHASPNGGWPEAAMAGALGVILGGPVAYDGRTQARAWLGEGRRPGSADLARGLRLYLGVCAILVMSLALGALAAGGFSWPR